MILRPWLTGGIIIWSTATGRREMPSMRGIE